MVNQQYDVLRFRVDLTGIEPTIWREILVPASYTFWDLHVAIQDAMGWENCHLHEFHLRGKSSKSDMVIGIPYSGDWVDEDAKDTLPGWELPVTDYFSMPGRKSEYVYDLGDYWRHQVILLSIEVSEQAESYPKCTGGKRACPPEDCGGPARYQELLSVLGYSEYEDHDEILEWIPQGWVSERFSPTDVQFNDPRQRLKEVISQ